ncbi:MAG: hypothetical protein M1821_000847 [Bathelium mastoideum]|nr:MAG: hypothetical protein M1821_000847 [Bathelium mastoideum]
MAAVSRSLLFGILALSAVGVKGAFNAPPGVEIWCGKSYQPENASFNPGGWLDAPATSPSSLLNVKLYSRMNIYTADDQSGSFIVDASISNIHGNSYYNTSDSVQWNGNVSSGPFTTLYIDITDADTGSPLVSGANVTVNSTGNEFQFSLANFTARTTPYNIVLEGASEDGNQTYTATAQLYKLPSRTDGGSVTKIDHLYGGLMVQNYLTNSTSWSPLFPYSYYVSWDWLSTNLSNLDALKSDGYNIVHIVPGGSTAGEYAFNITLLNEFLDRMDALDLWLMYDMRWTYQNQSAVAEQVNRIKTRKSLLLWYTGDEPDGNGDPLNATSITYSQIKSLDPYHPVSLCLNCYNFHYQEYTAGTDIVMEDVYPVAVNLSYSTFYGTVCNATYGCCGCDDCFLDAPFRDISDRLDRLALYDTWLDTSPPKSYWGVPQGFGASQFWTRYPTAAEEAVMDLLRVNHGAKALVAWDFPTQPDLVTVTSQIAQVLTSDQVTAFLLGAKPSAAPVSAGNGTLDNADAAVWVKGGQILVSVVSLDYEDVSGSITVDVPGNPGTGSNTVLWGDGWTVSNGALVKNGLSGLEVDLFILDVS